MNAEFNSEDLTRRYGPVSHRNVPVLPSLFYIVRRQGAAQRCDLAGSKVLGLAFACIGTAAHGCPAERSSAGSRPAHESHRWKISQPPAALAARLGPSSHSRPSA